MASPADTTKPSGTGRVTNLRAEVMRLDPDYARASEILPEYEFQNRRWPGGKRIFEGAYKHRGPYTDD